MFLIDMCNGCRHYCVGAQLIPSFGAAGRRGVEACLKPTSLRVHCGGCYRSVLGALPNCAPFGLCMDVDDIVVAA